MFDPVTCADVRLNDFIFILIGLRNSRGHIRSSLRTLITSLLNSKCTKMFSM